MSGASTFRDISVCENIGLGLLIGRQDKNYFEKSYCSAVASFKTVFNLSLVKPHQLSLKTSLSSIRFDKTSGAFVPYLIRHGGEAAWLIVSKVLLITLFKTGCRVSIFPVTKNAT